MDVIKLLKGKIKKILYVLMIAFSVGSFAQKKNDTIQVTKSSYKKKVLDNIEINFLYSNYLQNGNHAAVTGGVGDERLTDNTPAIIINIPLNADAVLSIDFGVDITTSASTDQINPFAKNKEKDDDDDDDDDDRDKSGLTGKPSQILATKASSGGGGDEKPTHKRTHGVVTYAHTSNNRTFTWNIDADFSTEQGYNSIGFGTAISKTFNKNNSEINFAIKAYLDAINPIYPGEFRAEEGLSPSVGFELLDVTHRNSYSASLSFYKILTKRLQIALIADIIYQEGLLSTNYQRVYFNDKPIEIVNDFELAHDIERLPNTRTKHPFGARLNYYVTDFMVLRTFYRHYTDNWGVTANTYDVQIPLKLSESFTLFPMYRFHTQQQARYFAPYRAHLSTETFYTSDYDLSTFNSSQYGLGFTFAPPLGIFKGDTTNDGQKIRFKSFDLRYNYYSRTDGLDANIVSVNAQFSF